MSKVINYLKETRTELKHVNWPSRKEVAVYTAIIIAVSLVTAALLGFFDYIFSQMIKTFFV
jgi:preprotein translocase subunit SecE